MKIDYLILGEYQTNCYVLRNDDTAKDCLVIDPGLEADELVEFLDEQKLNPIAVLLTHGHIDHIAGAQASLRFETGSPKSRCTFIISTPKCSRSRISICPP